MFKSKLKVSNKGINKYEHDKGLIQTINLKSGKRLETFLSKQNKEKQGERDE